MSEQERSIVHGQAMVVDGELACAWSGENVGPSDRVPILTVGAMRDHRLEVCAPGLDGRLRAVPMADLYEALYGLAVFFQASGRPSGTTTLS